MISYGPPKDRGTNFDFRRNDDREKVLIKHQLKIQSQKVFNATSKWELLFDEFKITCP